MKAFYLFGAVAGLLIPSYFTLLFCMDVLAGSGDLTVSNLLMLSPLFYQDALSGHVSTQLLTDVLIVSVVFFIWMFPEGRRLGMRRLWIYPFITYMVAFSAALPLFFYFRERRKDALRNGGHQDAR